MPTVVLWLIFELRTGCSFQWRRFVWHCAAEKCENLSVWRRVRFIFARMRFEQRNSAWIETESARSAAEASSLVVLYGRVRRGGGKGGRVGKIVKYGGMSNDRSSDKKSHKVRFEQALFKQIGPQLLYWLSVESPRGLWQKKKKLTTRGIPRRSPIQVLTPPDRAQLRWSDENRCIPGGMVVSERFRVKFNGSWRMHLPWISLALALRTRGKMGQRLLPHERCICGGRPP